MALPNIIQQINSKLPLSGGAFNKDSKLDFTGNDDEGYTRLNKSGGNGFFIENYDTASKIGSRLCLRSSIHSSYPGQFELDANDGVTKVVLKGNPNGSLTWGGKAVDCVHSSGTNYIRYTSGTAICWGSLTGTASTATITFPITFANANYRAFATDTGGAKCATAIGSRTTTNCTLYCYNAGNTWGVDWLAIGCWK